MIYRLPDNSLEIATPNKIMAGQVYDQATRHYHGQAPKQYGIPTLDNIVAHESRSKHYGLVSTGAVVERLEALGWSIKSVTNKNNVYRRHMVSMQHEGLNRQFKDATIKPQLYLINSYDGSSAFQVNLGLYRLVCANGLMLGTTWAQRRVVHRDTLVKDVEIEVETLAASVNPLMEYTTRLQSIELSVDDINEAIDRMVQYRIGDRPLMSVRHVNPRREADLGRDAFTILNRIQELGIRGGFSAIVQVDEPVKGLEMLPAFRELKAVDSIVATNLKAFEIIDSIVSRKAV